MKKHNPHTPIMIREASGIEPKVYARYGAYGPSRHYWGIEMKTVELSGRLTYGV
jgi:hypothetical protein